MHRTSALTYFSRKAEIRGLEFLKVIGFEEAEGLLFIALGIGLLF